MGDRTLTIYCGLLLALSAFSIDITLPFFDRIRDTLSASNAQTHAVITLYIFSIGIGQLVFGPLSDRFGRRRSLAIGLAIYIVGGLLAIFSASIQSLLLGRALQGFGGGAAPVVARAIIRDRFAGPRLAQNMALASGIFAFGPMVAPLIGALMVEAGGNWRAIFIGMLLLATSLFIALLRVPETLEHKDPTATRPTQMLRNIGTLFGHPQSRYFLLLCAWSMTAIMVILVGLPGVMETEFGVTGTTFALLFAIHGVGIVIGQIANHWMIGRYGALRSAVAAAALITAVFAATVFVAYNEWFTAFGLAVVFLVFAMGYLIVFSNGASLIMDPHPRIAGFTAAFFGSFTQVVSAGTTMIVMMWVGNSLMRWSIALLVVCATVLAALWVWHRRNT